MKPALKQNQVGIVGDGKVAHHFKHYLNQLGVPVRSWSRRASSQESSNDLAFLFQDCRTVLLLVADPAIDEIAARLSRLLPLFHFSGSWVSRFPHVHGAHPLMTFGPELYDLETYPKIPFVLEQGAQAAFRAALPELTNPIYSIPRDAELKARYHAFCSMAGSFSAFLWAKLFSELPRHFDIPPEAAVPFLEQLARNLAGHCREPERFFTGPIARRDQIAIEKHLSALGDDPYAAVYRTFAQMHQMYKTHQEHIQEQPAP
jgi:hypothetical protein